jgi:hypothetical protein
MTCELKVEIFLRATVLRLFRSFCGKYIDVEIPMLKWKYPNVYPILAEQVLISKLSFKFTNSKAPRTDLSFQGLNLGCPS